MNGLDNINIHIRISELLKLMACGLFFIAAGLGLVFEEGLVKIIVGWVGLGFGIVGELVVCYYVWLRLSGKPMVIIGEEEVKIFVPSKRKYETIPYDDVQIFQIVKVSGVRFIRAKFFDGSMKDSSINDAMFGKKRSIRICDMLNEKLEQYQDMSKSTTNKREV